MHMKRRILFVVTYFDTGGILRSLQSLLGKIDTAKYDVDVFGMVHHGMYLDKLPDCNILDKHTLLHYMVTRPQYEHGLEKIKSLVIKALRRVFGSSFEGRILKDSARRLSLRQYDVVVSFGEGIPTKFVSMISCDRKVAWIHCDYMSYFTQNNRILENEVYNQYASIVCVSQYTRDTFLSIYPEFKEKIDYIYNILDAKQIRILSSKDLDFDLSSSSFNIVSVGRIDPIKRFSCIPSIVRYLLDNGCNVMWYIVGPMGGTSDEYDKLIANIEIYAVKPYVTLLGERENPYNIIKNMDLVVNTSVSEACPYIINEAKILSKPVVCTDFGSSREFILDGVTGFRASIDDMPQVICNLVKDKALYNSIVDNLHEFRYDNSEILFKVYDKLS